MKSSKHRNNRHRSNLSLLMPLANGDNQVTMSVTNALGNVGFGSFRVRAKIDLDETKMRDPGSAPPYLADSPLYLSLPASFNTNAVDTIGVGLQAPTLDAPLETINEDAVASLNFTGTTTNALGEVSVNFPSAPTLNPSTRDTIQAAVTIPNLSLDARTLTFVETEADSTLFKLAEKKLRLRLGSINSGSIQVAEDEDGTVGDYATLNQTAPNTFEGPHPTLGGVQIVIQSGGAPNAAVQQEVLATVSAAGADIRQQAIAFEETGVATDEYLQEGIGYNVSGANTGAGANPFAFEVTEAVVETPTNESVSNPILFRYQSDGATNGMEKVVFEDRILDMKADPDHDGWMVTKQPVFFVKSPPSQMISNVVLSTDAGLGLSVTNAPTTVPVSAQVANMITTASERKKIPKGVNRVPVTLNENWFTDLPDLDGAPSTIAVLGITPLREYSGAADNKVKVDHIKHTAGSSQLHLWITVSGNHSVTANGGLLGFEMLKWGRRFTIKGTHEIVDLRVLILGLDGGGYNALSSAIGSGTGFFAETFSGGTANGAYDPGQALNSLPTLTFVNWATWLTGQKPSEHGILGNAFFPRDLIGNSIYGTNVVRNASLGLPFGCANRTGISHDWHFALGHIDVTLNLPAGAYDDKDNSSASEFEGLVARLKRDEQQRTALLYDDPVLQSSGAVNSQYGLDPVTRVNPASRHTATHFTDLLSGALVDRFAALIAQNTTGQVTAPKGEVTFIQVLAGHGPDSAMKLDLETKKQALETWKQGAPPEVQFLYFPGPDNVAHNPANTSQPAGAPMDAVIAGHLTNQTGPRMAEVWKQLKERGYEDAVLVVAIADHGLIRTPKSILTEQNAGLYGGGVVATVADQLLAKVYSSVTIEVIDEVGGTVNRPVELWRGGTRSIDEVSLVHAPNGGMAHIYMRGIDRTGAPINSWQAAPPFDNLKAVSDALYSECVGVPSASHTAILYPSFQSALAPLGTLASGKARVGLLMKRGSFADAYRIYNADTPETPEPIPADFGKHTLSWADATYRLASEMNDTSSPSRSGDILLLMDTANGVVAVHENDVLPGWHGGPTFAESEVPMIWSYHGAIGPDAAHRSDLITGTVQSQTEAAILGNAGVLRTRDFKKILLETIKSARNNQF